MRGRALISAAAAAVTLTAGVGGAGAASPGVVPKPGNHTGQTQQNFGSGVGRTPAFYTLDVNRERQITKFQTDFKCGRSNTVREIYFGPSQLHPYPGERVPALPYEPIQIKRSGERKGSFSARFQAPWRVVRRLDVRSDGVATVVFKGQWRMRRAVSLLNGRVRIETGDCDTGFVRLYAYN